MYIPWSIRESICNLSFLLVKLSIVLFSLSQTEEVEAVLVFSIDKMIPGFPFTFVYESLVLFPYSMFVTSFK